MPKSGLRRRVRLGLDGDRERNATMLDPVKRIGSIQIGKSTREWKPVETETESQIKSATMRAQTDSQSQQDTVETHIKSQTHGEPD